MKSPLATSGHITGKNVGIRPFITGNFIGWPVIHTGNSMGWRVGRMGLRANIGAGSNGSPVLPVPENQPMKLPVLMYYCHPKVVLLAVLPALLTQDSRAAQTPETAVRP